MQLVKRAEAARVLDLDRATITRWVNKNPALLHDGDLVQVDELRAFRDTVLNPKLQTRTSKLTDPKAKSVKVAAPIGPSLNDHRSRKEAAAAGEAELDFAARLQMTLRRDQVERAIADAGEVLKQKASHLVRDRAEALARINDVREMERALDEMMRDLLLSAARALAETSQGEKAADAA